MDVPQPVHNKQWAGSRAPHSTDGVSLCCSWALTDPPRHPADTPQLGPWRLSPRQRPVRRDSGHAGPQSCYARELTPAAASAEPSVGTHLQGGPFTAAVRQACRPIEEETKAQEGCTWPQPQDLPAMACWRGWVRSQKALKQKSGHFSPGVPKTGDRRHRPEGRQAQPWCGGE